MEDIKPERIPLADADMPTLKHFAETLLGIEVKTGTNAAQLRGKISAAAPELKDVPALPKPPEPMVMAAPPPAPAPAEYVPVEGENPALRPAAISRPASQALMHPNLDPKVRIKIHKTDDKRRSKEVTVSVNGAVWRMQRGVEIDVPYRVYLALDNAKEKAAVETDDLNPVTKEPIMGWEEIHSYPFTVRQMPSDEEIDAWEIATGSGFAVAA
jgi:hypothetical protein